MQKSPTGRSSASPGESLGAVLTRRYAGIGLAIVIAVCALAAYVLQARSNDNEEASAILARSQAVMRTLSFSSKVDCITCDEPHVLEYAPDDRMELSSPPQRDSWPHYLIVDGVTYFSEEGRRWMTGASGTFSLLYLYDPRALIDWTVDETNEGQEDLDGQRTTVLSATLDIEAFLNGIESADLDAESRESLREILGEMGLLFWVDTQDRVAQMALGPIDDDVTWLLPFDFEAPVDVPSAPESMPYEEANTIGQEVEADGVRILRAIGRYKEANGVFPPTADETTLAPFLEGPWPENAFTGEPMAHDPDSPGEFIYELRNGGNDIRFSVRGWDVIQMFYDSERFGPLDLP